MAAFTSEDLISSAERIMRRAVSSYEPLQRQRPCYAQAEYSCLMYFWVQHWYDQQPLELRTWRAPLDLLLYSAQDGANAISTNEVIAKGWNKDAWFKDRLRLYRSIVSNEPQNVAEGIPSIFIVCHLIATYAAKARRLDVMPSMEKTADLLAELKDLGIYGDSLEQLNLHKHATAAMTYFLPQITEIITELHSRR